MHVFYTPDIQKSNELPEDWLMLENTWISLLSFVIAQHFNNTTGCGPFD